MKFLNRNKVILKLLALVILLVVIWIFQASFSQPGKERWEGKYEEIGYFRNENNTGPIVRVLAVRVLDKDPQWMQEFGDAQPHSKYGRTVVLFFKDSVSGEIELGPKEPFFPEDFLPFLLAKYEKTPMAELKFLVVAP